MPLLSLSASFIGGFAKLLLLFMSAAMLSIVPFARTMISASSLGEGALNMTI